MAKAVRKLTRQIKLPNCDNCSQKCTSDCLYIIYLSHKKQEVTV